MAKKAEILVLSWGMPPAIVGSAIVIFNFLRQFSNQFMVAVGAYIPGHPPTYWDSTWPHIIYGMVQPPRTRRFERWICRIQFPVLFLISLITLLRYRSEMILATYPDQFFLLTGYLLSRLFKKPLFLYFHNTYVDSKVNSRFAVRLQNRVFSSARHVFVMSGGMQSLYQARYPYLSCSTLPHILNEIPRLPDDFQTPAFHRPVRLLFAGNINDSCAEAAGRFLKLIRENPDLALRIHSGMEESELKRIGFSGDNITAVKVPYEELLKSMREADIIIHPHGFEGPMTREEYQTIFPTKTIEYLISQRPILAHAPADSYIARFYRENRCALIVSEPSVDALAAAVDRLKNQRDLGDRLVRNAVRAARRFSGPEISKMFREVIDRRSH